MLDYYYFSKTRLVPYDAGYFNTTNSIYILRVFDDLIFVTSSTLQPAATFHSAY
ncbi:hypothetical protein BDD43_0085 [Mucilaginibacter gracilis]|uniref:Uncharacterized protein n=1 Tax=Mucilaginibacter gracilis TaxID=423350 RepID=A0A495IVH3_9SPHI|nr:hypothetical protein BDD43_0085 [Mucilaginibacter gracilis]